MRFRVTHNTSYSYSESVPVCHNQVHLVPRAAPRQTTLSATKLRIKPRPAVLDERLDYFGNHVTSFAVEQAHERLSVTAISRVELIPLEAIDGACSPAWEQVRDALATHADPVEIGQFAFDSPLIKASAQLAEYAGRSFPAGRPIVEAALDLNRRIHGEFVYDPTATTVSTPVPTVLELRRGVCQDFAHLAIGCLRSLGLAARYVSGYLLTTPPPGKPRLVGADASHAWFSVYTGDGAWLDLDPTNDIAPSLEHITLAWGRDYGDVCPIQGVFIGGGQHGLSVSVNVARIG